MANVPLLNEPNYAAGGMSFIQMVRRLRQESGTSGAPPVTIANQTGEIKRLIDWISSAWVDIQADKTDWFFMRQPVSFNTTAGKQSYTASEAGINSFGNFKLDSFRQYNVANGYGTEQRLAYVPYDTFRDLYQYGPMRTTQQMPVVFTVDPAKNFLLGATPNDVYNINGEGYAMPTELANDDDRPTMPGQYHMAIVWRALMYYGSYEGAPDAYTRGQIEYERLMSRLRADQMPAITFGPPLA